jgi:hypothetical protein
MRKSSIIIAVATLMAGGLLTGPADARDRGDHSARSDRAELSANQIVAQSDARAARMKADLRLTPEQEKSWSGFETALHEVAQKRADREIALRAARAEKKEPVDIIEQMRSQADSMSDRSADQKKLADAAQPLFATLDDQQKQRFGGELARMGFVRMGHERDARERGAHERDARERDAD